MALRAMRRMRIRGGGPAAAVGLVLILAACSPPRASDTPPGEPIPPADAPAEAAPAAGVAAGPINGVGTEPFWGLEIRPDHLALTGPDRSDLTTPNPGPQAQGDAAVWEARASNGSPLKVTLTAEACSDGMSDLAYPYRAKIETAGEALTGCAAPLDAWPKRPEPARIAR